MALGDQPFTVLREIVNLTVKDDLHAAIFIRHGLAPFRAEIDYRKPTMAQRHTRTDIGALVVRSAVYERVAHSTDDARIDPFRRVVADYATDSAHFMKLASIL